MSIIPTFENFINESLFRTWSNMNPIEFDKFKDAYLNLHSDNKTTFNKKENVSYGMRKNDQQLHWKYFHDDFKLYHSEKERSVIGLINFKDQVTKNHVWSK